MEQDTLKEILEAERQIKAMLDAERAKAQQWLEQIEREVDEATRSELSELEEAGARGKEEAEAAAEAKATAILSEAHSLAERIENLSDERLQEMVWAHVAGIVPRSARDR